MIDIRPILPTVEAPKVRSMLLEHWQETESDFKDEPQPNMEAYKVCEDAGLVVAFGAFDGDEMIGYAVAFVVPHMHHGFICAQHDLLFVKKEYRASRTGLILKRRLEEACVAKGAVRIFWHAKPGSTFSKILQKTCELEEYVFVKELSCQPS